MFPFRINFTLFCVSQYFRVLFSLLSDNPLHALLYGANYWWRTHNITIDHIIFYLVLQFLFCCTNLTMQKYIKRKITHVQGFAWIDVVFIFTLSIHCTCNRNLVPCDLAASLRGVAVATCNFYAVWKILIYPILLRVRIPPFYAYDTFSVVKKKKELRRSQRPWNSCTTDPCRIRSEADVEAETRASTDARVPAISCIMNITSILSFRYAVSVRLWF